MDNNMMELNPEQMETVHGGVILELIGEGIGYLSDKITEKIEDFFGKPQDGCTGEQVMPGFNVY